MKKLVIGSFALAILHSILFFGQDWGISVLLFAIPSVYLLIMFLQKNNKIQNKNALYISIPILLLSSTYLFFDNQFFNGLNIVVIPSLLAIMIMWATTDVSRIKATIENIIGLVLGSFEFLPDSIKIIKNAFKRVEPKEKNHKKIEYIILGIILSIPIIFIILGLLMSADGIFAEVMTYIFKNIEYIFTEEFVLSIIGRCILIIIITVYLICVAYNILRNNNNNESKNKGFGLNIEPTIINTLLTIVNIVYALFSLVQLMYIFGGVGGFNFNFAQYARQGFFQLMFIAFINFVIVIITNTNKKQEGKNKYTVIMNIIMCVFTVIIAISAFIRMRLYEQEYGYTFLRLMVYFILTTQIILTIPTILYIVKDKINIIKMYFIVITFMYVLANFTNIDYVIAKNNVSRALNSSNESIRKTDISYLTELGINAVPEIIKLYQNTNDEKDKSRLNNYLYYKYQDLKEKRNWQGFNISKQIIEKQLKELNLEYIKINYKHTDDDDLQINYNGDRNYNL